MDATIASCVSASLSSFKLLSHALGNADVQYQDPAVTTALADHSGRFKVWCGNVGAHQTGRSSLDYRLRNSDRVKKIVERLLRHLTRLLSEGEMIIYLPALSKIAQNYLKIYADPTIISLQPPAKLPFSIE